MGGSERTKSEARKMTVYFDERAEKQKAEEDAEAEKQAQREETTKILSRVIVVFARPAVLMLVWNWLMPGLFGLATIGYLKAFGLVLLSRMLFGKDD